MLPSTPTRVVLALNPKARRGKAVEPVVRAFENAGADVLGPVLLTQPHSLQTAAALALRNPGSRFIVGGGDGTVARSLAVAREHDLLLGVLPRGTGNALALDLGIPDDLDEAAAILTHASEQSIDLSRAGDRLFGNVLTCGASSLIASSLQPSLKRWLGKAAYVPALVIASRRFRAIDVTFRLEDRTERIHAAQVVVANGATHAGGLPTGPSASLRSGNLAVYAVPFESRRQVLDILTAMVRREHADAPGMISFETTKLRLQTSPPVRVRLDGDNGPRTPVNIECLPGALRVVVGPEAPGLRA